MLNELIRRIVFSEFGTSDPDLAARVERCCRDAIREFLQQLRNLVMDDIGLRN